MIGTKSTKTRDFFTDQLKLLNKCLFPSLPVKFIWGIVSYLVQSWKSIITWARTFYRYVQRALKIVLKSAQAEVYPIVVWRKTL